MKKLFLPKSILFCFSILLISQSSLAEPQEVDFSINKNLITQDGEILVSFDPVLSKKSPRQFLVRPVLENGNVFIFNFRSNKWVSSGALWTELPRLEEVMKLRISATGLEKTSLKLILKDPERNLEIETRSKPVWGKRIYSNYIESVNTSLASAKHTETGSFFDTAALSEGGQTIRDSKSYLMENFLLIFLLTAAVLSTAVLILGKRMFVGK